MRPARQGLSNDARRNCYGREALGSASSASWVECMMVPFGLLVTLIERVVGRFLMRAADTVQKCAVLPLSAIAKAVGGRQEAGRPTRAVVVEKKNPNRVYVRW